jgi:hypothetical protein
MRLSPSGRSSGWKPFPKGEDGNLFGTKGGRHFTAPHLNGKSPWTGQDSNTESNVFSTVLELPTSALGARPEIRIWGDAACGATAGSSMSTGPASPRSDPSKPAKYRNGRVFTDDVIDHRLAFLSKGEIPPDGLQPHTDTLSEFPYIGTPHPMKS